MARKLRWRPTLKQTIGVVLAGMILLTAGVLTATSYLSTRSTLLDFSRGLIGQNAEVVREQVDGFLEPAKSAAALTLELVDSGMVDVDETAEVERYFFNFLSVQPTVAMLNYGDRSGNFVMVKRQPDKSLSTKIIAIDPDGVRTVRWRHRDPGGSLSPPREVVREDDDPYDPRTRPWYVGAAESRGLYWTGVYVFHSDKQPGVTAAVPRLDADGNVLGVLAVDIGLAQMSAFLRERIRVGESGQAFLLDEKSQLIAVKDLDSLTIRAPDAGATGQRLRVLSESPVPEIAALADSRECMLFLEGVFRAPDRSIPAPHTLRYEVGGRDYVATLMPIQVGPKRRWVAGVVALEDEFLASAKRANLRALLTAVGFALIALLVGMVIARIITRSLNVLVRESERVRNLEIESGPRQSRFREVDEVLNAFEGMKTGLRAFEKYVPVRLVRTLMQQQTEPHIGGEARTLTIFFSDIRDFTTISEGLDPLRLAENLALYLSAVTSRIMERNGTVDKYIGDAVMAFWGAPQPVEDHADQACRAALEALRDLRQLATIQPEFPDFYTRIGIHTAEVVVGNFGSDDRFDYTIMGDGVNLASRLEGVNKVFGTQILLSEDTHALVKDKFETRRIGLVAVKGRSQPCTTYELIGPLGSLDEDTKEAHRSYDEGLTRYLDRDWEGAIECFAAVLERLPEDQAARRLLQHSQELQANPPPESWDGTIRIRSK